MFTNLVLRFVATLIFLMMLALTVSAYFNPRVTWFSLILMLVLLGSSLGLALLCWLPLHNPKTED